jgi:hypothetical protein
MMRSIFSACVFRKAVRPRAVRSADSASPQANREYATIALSRSHAFW